MADRVLISTHDLQRAGALRSAFERAGLEVEFVTPKEEIGETDARLLILTTSPRAGRALTEQLGPEGPPILAQTPDPPSPGEALPDGIAEVFGPDADPDDVALVGRALVQRHWLQETTGIVGQTDEIRQALERIVQIAPVNSTVLITGESGTGKELAARGIHALSPRRHKPFIAVNVAALSDTLLESELFGHEKGAFTGAIDSRKGLFELAHGGTIFLDEIGEMPLSTQTKLLRVLEHREFMRVGGEKSIRIDVRIVAATNQNLRQLVALREFRKDLFYRLNVLSIELPPLRERRADIPLLIRRFVREVSRRHDLEFSGISDAAMQTLIEHSWPGNVRELRNLVESMVVLAPGRQIQPEDIPSEVRRSGSEGETLPALIPRATSDESREPLRPELEFIFRTLVDLRVDIDDLRKEFENYRERRLPGESSRVPADLPRREVRSEVRSEVRRAPGGIELGGWGGEEGSQSASAYDDARIVDVDHEPGDEGVVVYREGMTMEEVEREAIRVVLGQVGGNRRMAAEELGIGERTLYRKIKHFGLDQ
ncbi:MAG: sigma 54-interacting transcriptional regulator [Longimicrobiales bacterium]|nr:sigma 54-interacting transcriptional regulator [Longimicrobiales bacterium]